MKKDSKSAPGSPASPGGVSNMYDFFNSPPSTTTGYLARAVVNEILQGDMGLGVASQEAFNISEMCLIS